MVLFTIAGAVIGGGLMWLTTNKSDFIKTSFAPSYGDIKVLIGVLLGGGIGFGFGLKFWYDVATN